MLRCGGVITEEAAGGQRNKAPELLFGRFVIEPRVVSADDVPVVGCPVGPSTSGA